MQLRLNLPVTSSPANRWKFMTASWNCLSGWSRSSDICGSWFPAPR